MLQGFQYLNTEVVQTQAMCNCRITAQAIISSTSYFPNESLFLLTTLGGLPKNPGIYICTKVLTELCSG